MSAWTPRFQLRLREALNMDFRAVQRKLKEDGYIIIPKFFDSEAVASAIKGCERIVNDLVAKLIDEGKITNGFPEERFETRLIKIFEDHPDLAPALFRKELFKEELFEIFFNDHLLDLMLGLTGAEEIRLFPNASVRPKMPQSDLHNIAWHQDAGLSEDGSPNESPIGERMDAFGSTPKGFSIVNCWTPLVPANRKNGCMIFLPGTHKLGIQKHVKVGAYRNDGPEHEEKIGVYSTQIDPEVVAQHDTEENRVYMEANPGDLIVFTNLLFHCNTPNASDSIRWSIDWRYQDTSKPTHRKRVGHVAKSLVDIDREIQTAKEWEAAAFV